MLQGTKLVRFAPEGWPDAVGPAAEREGPAAPTATPHRWQKAAPGVSGARQAEHRAPRTGAPHSPQNLPDVLAPHAGQGTVGLEVEDMKEEGKSSS
ncbi:MAG: hypothetical protein U0132_16100 [Gemmatimonadaceae bacterium]